MLFLLCAAARLLPLLSLALRCSGASLPALAAVLLPLLWRDATSRLLLGSS